MSSRSGNNPDLDWGECGLCGDDVSSERLRLGYVLCLCCGEQAAIEARSSWCVVPMNKSNYILVTDLTLLGQLNPKRT